MKITIFIAMKFRIDFETEINDYVRDCIDVEPDTPFEKVAEIINARIDSLSFNLNKSVSAQLHSLAS
jgi:hypothetical protein